MYRIDRTHHHNHHRQHYVYVNTWAIQNRFVFSIQTHLSAHIYIYSQSIRLLCLQLPYLIFILWVFYHLPVYLLRCCTRCSFSSTSFKAKHFARAIPRTKKASLFSLLLLHTFPIKILFSTYRIKKHICISFCSLPVDVFFSLLFSFTFYGPFISACATPLKLLWGLCVKRIYKKRVVLPSQKNISRYTFLYYY